MIFTRNPEKTQFVYAGDYCYLCTLMQRMFLLMLGWLAVSLGVVGIFVPLLPTTPFLLLASFLFYRSSPQARAWLLNNRLLGAYIRNYQIYKAIPLRGKIFSTLLLWVTIALSVVWVRPVLWVVLLLLGIAVGVSFHIWSFATLGKDKKGLK